MKNKKGIIIVVLIIVVIAFFVFRNLSSEPEVASETTSYQLYTSTENKVDVDLFFGKGQKETFELYRYFVYDSPALINKVKQLILVLLAPPPEPYVSFIPEGVILRDAFMDANKICYIDFSEDIYINHKGGTTYEYLTVYSIINSICYNFPEVNGIRILIDGKETDTLAGHINIDGILKPNEDLSKYKVEE